MAAPSITARRVSGTYTGPTPPRPPAAHQFIIERIRCVHTVFPADGDPAPPTVTETIIDDPITAASRVARWTAQ